MLHEAGVHVGLATLPLWLARDILSYFALDGDFDRIVGEEDGRPSWARPSDLAGLCRSLPPPAVGDRKFDMAGALANGIEGIGAGYGCGTEEELTGGRAWSWCRIPRACAVLAPAGGDPARVFPHGGKRPP